MPSEDAVLALLDKYRDLLEDLHEMPTARWEAEEWALCSAYEAIVEDLRHL